MMLFASDAIEDFMDNPFVIKAMDVLNMKNVVIEPRVLILVHNIQLPFIEYLTAHPFFSSVNGFFKVCEIFRKKFILTY